MASVTRRRRVATAAWLFVQAALLFALLPRDCCASHRAAASPGCHEQAAARQCPMRGPDGTPCPMHRAGTHRGAEVDCSLQGTCNGPMAGMLAQLSHVTIVTEPLSALPDVASAPASPPAASVLSSRSAPPDSPPPRG